MRWALLLPVAILAGMAGSLAGGIVAIPFSQAVVDTTGPFVATFDFVFAAGLTAPSHRRKVGVAATLLVTLLALGTFVLSTFTSIEEFAQLSQRARILTPISEFLGALYALFIFPAGSALESLTAKFSRLASLWPRWAGR
jgi:uncharacterized YccA/Bax inhibitor family protein